MKLLEVELMNICQYKHFKLSLSDGLNAIIGPNGTGKTNLLSSIYYGITSDLGRFSQTKDKVISQYAKPSDRSFIRLKLEHHGVKAEILRSFRPNTRSFTVEGQTPITAEKAVQEKIEAMLGLPTKIIAQYIFVNQWEMFSVLNETPTERSKDLYRLFGLEQAELCRTAISQYINQTPDLPTVDLDHIRSRLLANRNRLRELTNTLKQYQADPIARINTETLDDILNKWQARQTLQHEIADQEKQLQSQITDKEGLEEQLANIEAQKIIHKSRLKDMSKSVESANSSKTSWEIYTMVTQNRAGLTDRLQYTERKITSIDKNKDALAQELALISWTKEDEKKLFDTRLQHMQASQFLSNINDGISECPTCSTPVSELKSKIDEYRDIQTSTKITIDELSARHLSFDTKTKLLTKLEIELSKLTDIRNQLTEQLSKIPEVNAPELSLEEASRIIEQYQLISKKIAGFQPYIEKYAASLQYLRGQMNIITNDLKVKKQKLAGISISADDAEKAKHQKAKYVEVQTTISRLSTDITLTRKAIYEDESTIAEAARNVAEADKLKAWKAELGPVSDILHREALPRLIAQSHLEKLEKVINEILSELNVDFTVKSKDGLRFVVNFHDGRSIPAEVLSGGEKVVFALAWRMAINSEFANDIGLLCLDEPTAGLDKDRLECLKLALSKLKSMSKSRGLQCIIITHAEELMPSFDNVIDLKVLKSS